MMELDEKGKGIIKHALEVYLFGPQGRDRQDRNP